MTKHRALLFVALLGLAIAVAAQQPTQRMPPTVQVEVWDCTPPVCGLVNMKQMLGVFEEMNTQVIKQYNEIERLQKRVKELEQRDCLQPKGLNMKPQHPNKALTPTSTKGDDTNSTNTHPCARCGATVWGSKETHTTCSLVPKCVMCGKHLQEGQQYTKDLDGNVWHRACEASSTLTYTQVKGEKQGGRGGQNP